jgi:2,4-dienoyl-CoA reductase-like NADH-dependent reductase (Old Yellow Enzyme family)
MIPGLGSTFALAEGKGWIPNTRAWGPSNRVVVGHPRPEVIPTEVYDSLVEDFGQSARRAREAGFDFVSLHFCHGSLPHTNLSLLANAGRSDRYADHFLFCELILQRIQELCGQDFPIIPRLCCDENLQGGYDIDYFARNYAPRLHALGIAMLDCTFGSMIAAPSRNPQTHSTEFIGPGFYTRHAVNLENIRQLRQQLLALDIDMPLIGSANLGTPEHLRQMVSDGHADFAGVCRMSMDDPDYANKITEARENELRLSTRTGASLLQGNIFG